MTTNDYGWDAKTLWAWERSCDPCQRDEHEECLLAVRFALRFDGLLVPCACGCRDERGDEKNITRGDE